MHNSCAKAAYLELYFFGYGNLPLGVVFVLVDVGEDHLPDDASDRVSRAFLHTMPGHSLSYTAHLTNG